MVLIWPRMRSELMELFLALFSAFSASVSFSVSSSASVSVSVFVSSVSSLLGSVVLSAAERGAGTVSPVFVLSLSARASAARYSAVSLSPSASSAPPLIEPSAGSSSSSSAPKGKPFTSFSASSDEKNSFLSFSLSINFFTLQRLFLLYNKKGRLSMLCIHSFLRKSSIMSDITAEKV